MPILQDSHTNKSGRQNEFQIQHWEIFHESLDHPLYPLFLQLKDEGTQLFIPKILLLSLLKGYTEHDIQFQFMMGE